MISGPTDSVSRGSRLRSPAPARRAAAGELAALAASLFSQWDDGILMVDRGLRILGGNPALTARIPLSALCDDEGRLSIPALVRLARAGLGGVDGPAAPVELTTSAVAPVEEERPSGPPAPSTAARWTPWARAMGLGSPVRACALVLRDTEPQGATRAARELITTLSHELKGPLFHAQQAIEMLTQYPVPDQPGASAAVDRAAGSVRQIAAIVRDVTDVLHLDDPRRMTVRREPVDIVALVGSVSDTYQALAEARGVALELAIHPGTAGLPPVDLDPPLVIRALGNLVDNALKYAPAPGPVTLAVRRAGSLLNLEVSDCGPGIAPADQRRIFEPFVRLPAAAQISGSGLGLALAQRIARAHGGTLTVQSRQGGWTTFRLSLLLPAGA
ncbi:MAG TPA: HAMP domain-containing sensor histidine kinase [Verrucomicrobiae bacterium]|nr:HAMP domain-containing sensor histidine kinase [Verrucomicrobiae bacterium]